MLPKMGTPEWVTERCPEVAAKQYCVEEIRYYETVGRSNRFWWVIWQFLAIASAAAATIFAAGDVVHDSPWARALPAAVTTLATGLLAAFNFREEHVRQGVTHDALRGELAKFVANSNPYEYGKADRAPLFLSNIRKIISAELEAWRAKSETEK